LDTLNIALYSSKPDFYFILQIILHIGEGDFFSMENTGGQGRFGFGFE
jgi:hypothetical protein